VTDRIDRSLTLLWGVLGAGLIIKPAGYIGWQDIALWVTVAWLATMMGLWYLRSAASRA
jgi:hypothetical protein